VSRAVLLLAVETSTPATSAAVVGDDGPRALVQHVAANRHGELLAPAVAEALSQAGVTPRDLTHVVAGVGPGPFTGLRVGVTFARTTAHALGVPALGVCSLDALAAAAGSAGDVVAVTDARRREVYWARYVDGRRVEGPQVGRPADVATALGPGFAGRVVGAGAMLHAPAFAGLDLTDGFPDAAWVGALAVAGNTVDPVPLYLRRPDAVEPGAPKPVLR
jgi:tRNA threonylcarbamoyladenosine biosynthesis protein TsaB